MSFIIENGCFSYKGSEHRLLQSINLSAEGGDLVAILGPNGSGKTTLLRCAMGFLRWSSGASLLNGRDIKTISTKELWRNVAYVPQARSIVSAYTVREMILLGRSSRIGVFAQPRLLDMRKADEVMDRLGITKLKDKRCNAISGGELQMALIARALAAEPELLILDEPESNLDFRNQLLVMDTMSEIAAEGLTCIFNTHYPAHAMRRANKALLLTNDGRNLFGSVESVVTEANIERAFGVKAVISEIETPVNVTRDVIPVMVSKAEGELGHESANDRPCLATVSIITHGQEQGGRINALLHEYNSYLIGRMGMPYRKWGVNIINVNVDAPESVVRELTQKLGVLPSVSVKATFAMERPTDGSGKPDEDIGGTV